jgi:hypothetical protein
MNIYLDDIRTPKMSYKDFNIEFTIVRSYAEFCDILDKNLEKVKFISFDHDLADFVNGKEMNGLDCANYLIDACIDNDMKLPDWYVHSDNTSGRENIISKFINYMKVVDKVDISGFNKNHRGYMKGKFI